MSGLERDELDLSILKKPLNESERPTDSHYTLEVRAYWNNDLLDTVESGRRRSVVIGGYNAGRRPDLEVELPHSLSRFTVAKLDKRRALITIPEGAQLALRNKNGEIVEKISLHSVKAPFSASAFWLSFDERLAYRLGALTIVAQFVRFHGSQRRAFDWLLPKGP